MLHITPGFDEKLVGFSSVLTGVPNGERMRRSAIAAFMICGLATANAAEIHLADGSVVVGTIISLKNGEDLIVDTEHMDEVVIEWNSVIKTRNTKVVDVELFDGRRLTGKLVRDGDEIEIDGASAVQLSANEIFEIDEFNETVLDGFSADTNIGMNIVRGNNQVTQLSIGAGLGYDGRRFESSLRGTTIINEQAESVDTRRSTLTGSYTHKISDGWQAIGSLQFEADEQQDLDGRTLLAGAIGKRVYNQRKHRLELFAGMAINSERFAGLPQSESLEGLAGARYRMRSFADIDASLSVLPNLEDSDRVRVQFDASLSFDLYSDLDFKITVYDRYDSQPPAGNEKNDYGTTLGLSWSY
jgi:putative salt-induced outer membrane protein YdiY